jgi:hypothetical protein
MWFSNGAMMRSIPSRNQLKIDFAWDDRVEKLAIEFGILLVPYVSTGTPMETVKTLAGRLAMLAAKRLEKFEEPKEPIRCHSCDYPTKPDERARVVVCGRCALEGASSGSGG